MVLTTEMLEITDLVKDYGGGVRALGGVTISAASGQVLGVLGPNGAGKTTMVRCVLGLSRPTSGTVSVAGRDVAEDPAHARRCCSFQSQGAIPLHGMKVHHAVSLAGEMRGLRGREARRRADELLERFELGEWAGRPVGTTSGGISRLVGFCMAVVAPGSVVVLDEPTNDVDPARRRDLWTAVRELADDGHAVVLVTHNLHEVERVVDRVVVIHGGRVLHFGPVGEIGQGAHAYRLELHGVAGDAPVLAGAVRQPGPGVVYAVDTESLADVGAWATTARSVGTIGDFSLSAPSLDDRYAALLVDREVAA